MRHRLELGKKFMTDYSHTTHAKFASICGKGNVKMEFQDNNICDAYCLAQKLQTT